MILEIDDSKEIKEILDEIPKCQVNEFQNAEAKADGETDPNGATEPNDSPFRVRRLSRSFSIPNGIKLEDKLVSDELLVGSNDENRGMTNNEQPGISKFILLKRSRSLGNIFLPTNSNVSTNAEAEAEEEAVDNLTEKVEALEIEVLPKEEVEIPLILINRPQTSPPVLLTATKEGGDGNVNSHETGKLSILDRMQKSLGFIFRCARKEEEREEEEEEEGMKKKSCSSTSTYKYPMRSRTPDPKFIRKHPSAVAIPAAVKQQEPPPMQSVNVNNFVTKIDSEPPKIGKLPQFFDVSGPKGPLLQPQSQFNLDKKCLVLDLDETLVHSSFHVPEAHDLVVNLGLPDGSHQNIYVAKRPGVDEFLARACEQFEVVIFTASLAHYADPVIDFLTRGMNEHLVEPRDISLRLYRESCLFLRGLYVKDLSRLGRKLEHTVIVDNSPASFLLQPDHGIPIKSWFSDTSDRELAILQESLAHLVTAESVSQWRHKLSSV